MTDPQRLILFASDFSAGRAALARAAGVSCRTKFVDGNPATEIVGYAHENDADVLVVGTHGRTGLARAMLGSVAEKIIRHARCAVLTVPYSKRAA